MKVAVAPAVSGVPLTVYEADRCGKFSMIVSFTTSQKFVSDGTP